MNRTKFTVAAWNVLGPRGDAPGGLMREMDLETGRKIRTLLENENPDFAFFQEVPPLKYLEDLDQEHFFSQISSRGEDYCRGIVAYRKDPAVSCEVVPGNPAFPAAAGYIFRSASGEELFRFLGVWNNPYQTGPEHYFSNFASILKHFRTFCRGGKNLIIAGDTNLILHASAYRSDARKQKECAKTRSKLKKLLEELELPPVYPVADNADTLKFTGNGDWYRCDLLLVSDSLRDGLKTGLGRRDLYIDEAGSDHLPILAEFYA